MKCDNCNARTDVRISSRHSGAALCLHCRNEGDRQMLEEDAQMNLDNMKPAQLIAEVQRQRLRNARLQASLLVIANGEAADPKTHASEALAIERSLSWQHSFENWCQRHGHDPGDPEARREFDTIGW